jgi:predicted site-specific integrase-resolvase
MRIPQIDKLPDVAQRAEWARLLEVDYTTLARAENRGDIKGYRPTGRAVIYTKETILQWLGVQPVQNP